VLTPQSSVLEVVWQGHATLRLNGDGRWQRESRLTGHPASAEVFRSLRATSNRSSRPWPRASAHRRGMPACAGITIRTPDLPPS